MPIPPLSSLTPSPGVPATNRPADAVTEAAQQRHEKLKKACQEFEAIFIGMMLKQMRKSLTGSNALFGNSSEAKLYQEMSDEATASQMSRAGGLGLADLLCKRLEGR
ncbi:MAG TPA: rod-binding protein [Chthonomonadaceae bacterium]|nr:rod-binding protein [Chthonomonadaceae bacterium]